MSMDRARAYLRQVGFEDRIMEFDVSSATVELAAQAVGCAPAHIVKTLSFRAEKEGECLLILAAGDARIDNAAFRKTFGYKAKMLAPEEAERLIGHAVGGVCPFGVEPGARVYLDVSMKRFDVIYPAAGTSNSAVRLSVEDLEKACPNAEWVDVCKNWRETPEATQNT